MATGTFDTSEQSDSATFPAYHIFTKGVLKTVFYQMVLSGYQASLADVILPISAFSANKRTTGSHYLSCTIPYSDTYKTYIQARSTGYISVIRTENYVDGTTSSSALLSVPLQTIRHDQGARSSSITLSGNKTTGVTSGRTRALTGVSSKYETNGSLTLTGDVDLFLEVGDTATNGSDSFVADSIGYVVSTTQSTMQVSQA
jgi:hypothetical protein